MPESLGGDRIDSDMDSSSLLMRVLLPAKPEDDLEDVTRVLRAFLPVQRTHIRRLYVHRPVRADFSIPRTYPRFNEIAQLERDAENATRVETERDMKTLSADGFRVSADLVRGTPTEEVLRETTSWGADLVGVRTRSLAAEDRRIGGMASALLHNGDCPVLTHHDVPEGYRVRRILIPTDFSEGSRQSADWGLALAALTGAEPVLLHVIARRANRHGIDQDELLEIATGEVARWKARLDPILPGLVNEGRVMAAETPAEGILAFARERGCDLIVLSAMGVSAVRAILLGSNTRKVVRASVCPVLVIPASNRVTAGAFLAKAQGLLPPPAEKERKKTGRRFERILVATDFSAASAPAFAKAIVMAKQAGAELTIAHAYQPPSMLLDGYVPPATYEKWDHGLEEEVRKKLQHLVEDAEKAGVVAVPLVLTGNPDEAITEAARDLDCDLVIMGTHGRTGVSRFFLGSVASRVISTAPCPVMTIQGGAVPGP
jgi:nucleotide-binding universal stress UspA family protein